MAQNGLNRKKKIKSGAFASFIAHRDLAAVHFHNFFYVGEAQPKTFFLGSAAIGAAVEFLENTPVLTSRQPYSIVGETHPAACFFR